VHEVCAYEPGEGEWSVDDFLSRLGQTEDEKGDQSYGDLDAHRIFGYAEDALRLCIVNFICPVQICRASRSSGRTFAKPI
jgi:hypothetical protein